MCTNNWPHAPGRRRAPAFHMGWTDRWLDEVTATQPIFAAVVDGQAVSVCRAVRRSAHGIEAGIDTLVDHRRRGHARNALAAWCAAIRQQGLQGFYGTSWSNTASAALAKSVGLQQFAAELSVS